MKFPVGGRLGHGWTGVPFDMNPGSLFLGTLSNIGVGFEIALCFGTNVIRGWLPFVLFFLLSRSEMLSGGEGQKSPRHPKPYLTIRNWNEADWS